MRSRSSRSHASVEIVGPYPTLLCEEHAQHRLEEGLPDRWEQEGVEKYARDCEAAANQLDRWMSESGGVLYEILEEASTYLTTYELQRARAQLEAEGGTPHPTEGELKFLEYFRRSAREYGWTDKPAWVTRLEGWMARLEA
jgi:hypothetical protein